MKNVESFVEMLKAAMDAEGLPAIPGIRQADKTEVVMYMLRPEKMLNSLAARCAKGDVREFVCGIDAHTRPDQGTTLDSAVIVFHARMGEPTRVGVWEYSWNDGEPQHKQIVWDNEFWGSTYAKMAREMDRWTSDKGEHIRIDAVFLAL